MKRRRFSLSLGALVLAPKLGPRASQDPSTTDLLERDAMFMLVDAQERDSFRAFMQFMIDHWDVAEPSLPRTWLYVHVPNVATSDGAGFGIPCSWDPVPEDSRWNSLYWGWRVMRTAELATTFPE
jgi:hypothetical protein